MTCCAPGAILAPELAARASAAGAAAGLQVPERWMPQVAPGVRRLLLHAPDISCAACIARIEGGLAGLDGVRRARVGFGSRQVSVDWQPERLSPAALVAALRDLGYPATVLDPAALPSASADKEGRRLLAALAVTGFAAANIMLLSVAVWSGAEGATRDLLHWVSALIALPAVAYGGQPFFRSALTALRAGRANMDVPISLAVLLAAGYSMARLDGNPVDLWFDAAVTLLFFLLIGRYLDHVMRRRASDAGRLLGALVDRPVTVIAADGTRHAVAAGDLRPGMRVALDPGERIAFDGRISSGATDLETSALTGETVPVAASAGSAVQAGMVNLTGPVEAEVSAAGGATLLGQLVRMMDMGQGGHARAARLSERVARLYVPVVHGAAAATFAGWWLLAGDAGAALVNAIAVLIITCPCALGLAIPAVQVAASGRLFRRGLLARDGAALEALAGIDTVAFDKTGTLTADDLRLVGPADGEPLAPDLARDLALAAALAKDSRHPLPRALLRAATERQLAPVALADIVEHPGQGLAGRQGGLACRLGSRSWCAVPAGLADAAADALPEVWLRVDRDGASRWQRFAFADRLRPDAEATVAGLRRRGLHVMLLSGDRAAPVAETAARVGIDDHAALQSPDRKVAAIAALQAAGHRVLMVGDGLNDAPALAAADVSLSPGTAADISRAAASMLFMGASLRPVLLAVDAARRAHRLILQNLGLAGLYNLVAMPAAAAGLASPMIAAIAMSLSSLVVCGNALRMNLPFREAEGGRGR
ncbi:MAG: heavy metal translocating P-type ATPase [Sneathiellaceae bacterium]